ncbi:MAG TPA: hypothetical protein VKX39_00375 [Bryobacteraceae bacterium]|jgi:hypothetical protein|nr:hypothetical protein [Bryobacteraceae bacterium]
MGALEIAAATMRIFRDSQVGELLGMGDRQHPQPDGIEQLENRGIGPDAERKGKRRHGEKAGIGA